MTVRVPTCSAMRIHLRRPYFSRPSTKRACSWADQRPALRFRVTVSPGRGRRCVFEVWSTPAVAQARANPSVWVCVAFGSARETKRRGFLSGAKNATSGRYTGFELRLVGGAVAAQGQLRLDFGATTGAYILGAAPEVVGSFQCQHAIILAMLRVRSVGHETFRTRRYPTRRCC